MVSVFLSLWNYVKNQHQKTYFQVQCDIYQEKYLTKPLKARRQEKQNKTPRVITEKEVFKREINI